MDLLTFISKIFEVAGNFAWPVAFIIGIVIFREPLKKMMLSIKSLKYKELEMEMVEPQDTSEQEINNIISYLQRGAHSFQWFRDNTEIQYTDKQFNTLLETHKGILEAIRIARTDEETKKTYPSLPGMRLTQTYRQNMEKAMLTQMHK